MEHQDRGTTIRNPSSANFLIDSMDRPVTQTAANFTIAKNNSLFNGFFTRLAVAEVVLNWNLPNIATAFNNFEFSILLADETTLKQVQLTANLYTVASALNAIVAGLNALPVAGYTFVIDTVDGQNYLTTSEGVPLAFTIVPSNLATQLGFTPSIAAPVHEIFAPYLLSTRYIDFVSTDLTYNQALKDATTDARDKTVLYRWYFAWDESPPLDEYGYPILQGYTSFVTRRALPFPKQIRWETNMPIGTVNFQVFDDKGNLLQTQILTNNDFNWGMQLLVSEC